MHNIKLPTIAAVLTATCTLSGAELTINVNSNYLNIPISHSVDRIPLIFQAEGKDPMKAVVRLAPGEPDYWVFADVTALKGKTLTITYPDGTPGINAIYQADTIVGHSQMYAEKNRPQFHFTTRRGWINDPNGLVYDNGEYHLFYQHNPFERDWENMSWGHAVSPDLVHWHELPVVLYPDSLGTIFSGSAVIDYNNDSGFGSPEQPAMVVAYTINNDDRQMQGIAYSNDHGRTFTKYSHNPVIDSKEIWDTHDTRDPRIFRYGEKWVMVLNERDGHSIYDSANLRDWTFRSHITGFWECPELFQLPVDDNPDHKMWVMYGASGTYMLGDFDGESFTPASGKHRYSYGTIYAAQTFNNIPSADGRRIQIGWGRLGHPDMPFNGIMLMPTELQLRTTKDGVRLVSNPVKEIQNIFTPAASWTNLTQDQANEALEPYSDADCLRLRITFHLSHATDAALSLAGQRLVDYDLNGTTLNGWHYSPQDPTSMELTTDIYIDRTSVEVFADGGLFSYSLSRSLPEGPREGFRFHGNRVTIKNLEVFTASSIWTDTDTAR